MSDTPSSPDIIPVKQIDPRLQFLSYSSLLTLHSCPRKYQLDRLKATTIYDNIEDLPQSVTFAFGTVVGMGVQELLEHGDLDRAIWQMFLEWEPLLDAENTKQKKSFYLAVFAVMQFNDILAQGYLADYELVYTAEGKPAVELSFCIDLGDGFTYRGYVDVVMKHSLTSEVIVVEIKTSSANSINAAQYKNSSQAIGYSVILDKLFPKLSSYQVFYLVYSTKSQSYEQLPFDKSLLQRALWLQELWLDKNTILTYEQHNCYPMHGESCFSYFRECEYLGLCTLSTERLTGEGTLKVEPPYDYYFTIDELIESQIAKGNGDL